MKKKEDKQKEIESLRGELAKSPNVFVTGYERLNVAQDFELRKAIRAAGAGYRVIKNNLAALAAEGTPAAGLLKDPRGMTSLAYSAADPVALAKTLTAYAKANPSFTFKAGMVEGRVIDIGAITELANMPAREQILAQLLFMIKAPGQRLAQVINAVGRNMAVVVDQGVKEDKFQA